MPGWLTAGVIVLAMVLVAIFFVTGADAASIAMGSLSSNGAEHPRRGVVIFWGSMTAPIHARTPAPTTAAPTPAASPP